MTPHHTTYRYHTYTGTTYLLTHGAVGRHTGYHTHAATCRKGASGKKGCRMARPAGHPVPAACVLSVTTASTGAGGAGAEPSDEEDWEEVGAAGEEGEGDGEGEDGAPAPEEEVQADEGYASAVADGEDWRSPASAPRPAGCRSLSHSNCPGGRDCLLNPRHPPNGLTRVSVFEIKTH